jgi:1,4-alpha-glucan branching enzyme
MTPNAYESFFLGVPKKGKYEEILNSDKDLYGGSDVYNGLPVETLDFQNHGFSQSIEIKVAPLSITILKYRG